MMNRAERAAIVSPPLQAEIFRLAGTTGGLTVDVDGIIDGRASSLTEETVTSFGGATGGTVHPARNVVVTTTSHADIDAVTVVLTGKIRGRTVTDKKTLTNGGGESAVAFDRVQCFQSLTSIYIPAQSGTGGSIDFGWGSYISFEPWIGRYVVLNCDVAWGISFAAPNVAITQPDLSSTGEAAAAARCYPIAAATDFAFVPREGACVCKVDFSDNAVLSGFIAGP